MVLSNQRPGGMDLTKEWIERCNFPPGSHLFDIGCGHGETVAALQELGHHAEGIDLIEPVYKHCLQGDACHLPIPSASQDGVVFECSLSRINQWKQALQEAARVLKPNGLLVLSDVIALGSTMACDGLLGALRHWSEIESGISAAGFMPVWQADRSGVLRDYWAKLVFALGPGEAKDILGGDYQALKQALPGYILSISRKGNASGADLLKAWTRDRIGYQVKESDNVLVWQLEQLQQRIEEARQTSDFFRHHLAQVDVQTLDSLKDLHAIPTMDSHVLIEQGMRLLTVSQSQVERVRTVFTSGSTSAPKRFWFTAEDLERTVDFFAAGMQHMAYPDDTVAILMSDATPDSIADLLGRGLARYGALGIPGGHLELDEMIDLIMQSQTVIGLPAQVYYLSQKQPDFRPRSVLLSADYVPMSLVRAIEQTWKCPVYSHYGLTETCYGLAVQCPGRDSHHLRSADFLVEILNPATGLPKRPGEAGEIVLSSLQPRAVPLIRYRTGDIGTWQMGCVCHETLPGLGRILGRKEYLQNHINIHALDEVMYSVPGIHGYQARYSNGRLYLLVEGPVDESEIRQRLTVPFQLERGPAVSNHPEKHRIKR